MSEHLRPRLSSRTSTSNPVPCVPQLESLVIQDGAIGEEAAELLSEFAHPHKHSTVETLVGSETTSDDGADDDELDKKKLPWWKRPSPWWLLAILPFTSIAASATIAPRIEIYTILACRVHKPDVFKQNFPDLDLGLQNIPYALPSGLQRVYLPSIHTAFSGTVHNQTDEIIEPPDQRNQCTKDPVVQAAVARLAAVITACMGILSCITTGWWGSFSDRYGRTRVMGISILALLITDFNFIVTTLFTKHIPGGYWFLIVGPTLEGLLGGMTTGIAAIHGYMADTTSESNRSRVFSLSLGLIFTGMAIGPTLGSLLIRFTGQVLSVFYVAAGLHVAYTVMVWTIIPESLSKNRMEKAKANYALEMQELAQEREQNPAFGLLVSLKRVFAFLSPLTVFLPVEDKSNNNPLKKSKKDYNLMFMAIGYGVTLSLMGSYSSKFLYAASTFGWTSETIGYWLSIIGASRAIFLTLILPLTIKLLKPKPVVLVLPAQPTSGTENTPLLDDAEYQDSPSTSTLQQTPKTITKEIHSPTFDLGIALFSLVIEIIGYTFMGLAPTGFLFTVFGVMSALGVGFSPAVQSVTLTLYARRGGTETGRLFGAMSVIQALCSQIVGPAMYGFIYAKTVATYPRTIFFVTVVSLIIAFISLCFVRLPKEGDLRSSPTDLEEPHQCGTGNDEESISTDTEDDTSTIRARSVVVGSSAQKSRRYGSTST